jgi:hypothetical protein
MAYQPIVIGAADAKAGDNLFTGATKINANFTELYSELTVATVTVSSLADFPAPVGNVVKLADNIVYIVVAHIDLGINTISYGVASEIRGLNTSVSSLSSTSTNPMIECTNQLLRLSQVILANPNGDLFDFAGSSSAAFLIDQVGAFSFLNIGTFHNTDIGVMNECLFDGFANGIIFTGTGVGSWSIMTSIFTGFSGVAVDFGTASIGTTGLSANVFSGLVGSTSLSGLPNSGNITVRASIDKNVFDGAGTALVGISPSDVKYTFTNNTNIADTRNAADMFLTGGSETITTGSAGDWQEIGVPSGGGVSWSSDILDRFTVSAGGVLTYIGEADIEVSLAGRATIEKVGGGSDILEVRFAVNWTGSASDGGLAKSRAQSQNADPTTVPIGALVALSTGNDVRVIFSNTTGASNIVASVASVEVTD